MEATEDEHSTKIVNIFDSRISAERIKNFTENFYISTQYSPFEKITYANNKNNNPYPAEYVRINGIPWQGRITCGHNPFLLARIVSNLTVVFNKAGKETVSSEEQLIPKDLGI